ncbi:hypothetical protein [Marinobacterium stanieri]|nr:hypothetical protein [Marinobacterium stanieri]
MNLESAGKCTMLISLIIMTISVVVAFKFESSSIPIAYIVISHAFIMLSAISLKIGYIIYLEGEKLNNRYG